MTALRSALSSGERPKRPNALSASLAFGWRALLKIKHVPEQLFDAVGNLASNVFVDPKTMPGWLRTAVGYNPITHLVSAIRDLMSGTVPAGHIAWLLVGCVALVAVFAPITMRLYRNKG